LTPPVISLAQANRYLLMRQHLLQPCSDPLQAVHDACGLQAQVPSAPALSLRARVTGFTADDYNRLLVDQRTLVRTWAMRGTIHAVPSDQLAMYTAVYAPKDGLTPGMQVGLDLLREGPATRKQLIEKAVLRGIDPARAAELFGPWGGVLSRLARTGLTVHMPAPGADVPVARTEDWLGPQPPLPPREALEEALLMAYAHGYGPVTQRDMAHFTNFKMGQVREILARLGARLAEVRLEGSRLAHYLPAADLPDLLAITGEEKAPLRLLPRFDSVVLAHKDKTRLLDEAHRRQVFREAAVVEATVLLDGRVAGTWRMKTTTRELRFEFSPFRRMGLRLVKAEAQRLAKWLGLNELVFTTL
jgi:hypothetical protein